MAPAQFRAGAPARQLDKLDIFDQGRQAIVLDHIGLINRLKVVDLISAWMLLDEAAQCGLLLVDREVAQGRYQQIGIREERHVTVRDAANQTCRKDAVQCQLAGVVRGVRDHCPRIWCAAGRANRDLARRGARGLHLARGLSADFLQPADIDVL